MSLETQVAELVTSAKKLVSEVAGKLGAIDKRVDAAVKEIPKAIRSTMDMETYVHPERGNDSNSGSQNQPLKTLMAALSKGFNGVSHKIYLQGGFEYVIDDNMSFQDQLIEIAPINPDSLSDVTRPVIKFKTINQSSGVRVAFISLSSSNLILRSVEVQHPYQFLNESTVYNSETRFDVLFNLTRKSMLYTGYAGSYSGRKLTLINLGKNLPPDAPTPRVCVSSDGMNDVQLSDTHVAGTRGIIIFNRRGGASYVRVSDGSLDEGVTVIPPGFEDSMNIVRSSYFL